MERTVRKVLAIVNLQKPDAGAVLEHIIDYFSGQGIAVARFAFDEELDAEAIDDVDLAVTLGGDGTLLHSAAALAARRIPILAVNLGQVGFLTEVSRQEWARAFEEYRRGRLGVSERAMLHCEVFRQGGGVFVGEALNDAVITTRGISRLIHLELHLAGGSAGRYRADGVIVSTPTGSTAYAMAAGGPILHPEMEAFLLIPICPYTLSDRPLVVPAHERIEIQVERTRRAEVILALDGQRTFALEPGDRVRYSMGRQKCTIIRSDRRNFYEVLRSKLNWAGEPNA